MSKPLHGVKIAILVANGFCEADMTETQRALAEAGANIRIVSPEQGLVNGWTGESWGHHFAVDATLSTALGADYAMVVVPGGQRSHDKLKLTAHTRRFVSSFLMAKKPVVLFDDALNVLLATETAVGRTVNGPEKFKAPVETAGGMWSEESPCLDDSLMSGKVTAENRKDFIKATIVFFAERAVSLSDQASKAA
jgi:protease I